jgi:hypothetical protein
MPKYNMDCSTIANLTLRIAFGLYITSALLQTFMIMQNAIDKIYVIKTALHLSIIQQFERIDVRLRNENLI